MSTVRRRSSSASRSPTHALHPLPRREPPPNPPEPPLTLLHPVTSPAHPRPLPIDETGPSTPTLRDTPPDVVDSGAETPSKRDRRSRSAEQQSQSTKKAKWKGIIGWFAKGMINDVKKRAPWYVSDWTDAWNYRVVPATWFIFFANVLPGIAFSLDLIETTGQYGVQEVLLASFIAAGTAGLFGAQPLLISGVTGPITVFNKTIYDIFNGRDDGFNYLEFIGWVCLWGAIFHWIAAVTNAVAGLRYVTRFSCDTFGFYVATVYVQYGIQVVTRQFGQSSTPSAFLGILLALITLITPHYFNAVARSGYVNRQFRRFCSDYGMPITIIAATGLAYWGRFDRYVLEPDMTLPVTRHTWETVNGRSWLVRFWHLDAKYVGIAFPFGLVLFILFYFDANVSALIAQGSEYPLRKPAGFHWDFFLLGVTTFVAGLLGIPAPNGLIPQAPLHTASLVVLGYEESSASSTTAVSDTEGDERPRVPGPITNMDELAIQLSNMEDGQSQLRRTKSGTQAIKRRLSMSIEARKRRKNEAEENMNKREVPISVVEQRVSNLAQGALCLVLMTKPFEHVLGLVPKGVLAGLFWYMGSDALLTSGMTEKMLYLIRDKRATSPTDPLNKVRKSKIILFTLVELIGFGATFAITQTIAAIGFPIIIMLLVPLRYFVVPRLDFTDDELDVLDGPVASPFTMESVGGAS